MQLSKITPVTILVRYDNEEGEQEERYPGFLTGGSHAMYVDPGQGTLIFVGVEKTDDPKTYLDVTGCTVIGSASDSDLETTTLIEQLANKLHSITAYEFLSKVIVHLQEFIEFENLIVPKLLDDDAELHETVQKEGD